ncbi:hypothetical protein I8H89_01875 [Candidatus Saccharibacteria bacterium]|nr:hypothetical protein [Candidatus Saccharibacteria bacterium]
MSVIDKVRALDLPDDQYVVIGSGLLDAWDLRETSDVDLVVSDELFDKLAQDRRFSPGEKHGDRFLEWDDYEVFDNWGAEGAFDQLYATSIVVEGVRFVAPSYLIAWKEKRNWEKDRRDISLLRERLRHDK